jgi:undecaprenyl diphosphate synthase
MDGNRTWAKTRFLPTFEGHRRGYENMRDMILAAKKRSLPYVSFWALSDDNIKKRSQEEVAYLFDLLEKEVPNLLKDATKESLRIVIIGNRDLLPETCQKALQEVEEKTASYTGMTVIIAIGYGGQDEVIRAIHAASRTGVDMGHIDIETFRGFLDSGIYPPPDLIVRTGGICAILDIFSFILRMLNIVFLQRTGQNMEKKIWIKHLNLFLRERENSGSRKLHFFQVYDSINYIIL